MSPADAYHGRPPKHWRLVCTAASRPWVMKRDLFVFFAAADSPVV